MVENIYKEIQDAIIEKFGINCSAELKIDVYPNTSSSKPLLRVTEYEIQADGNTEAVRETYVQSSGGLQQLPMCIKEVKI